MPTDWRETLAQPATTARERLMYGCNVEDLRQFVESSISVAFAREPDKRDGIAMLLTSMLSDVQELILLEHADDARRTINRVKYILNEYLARAPQ